LLSTKADKKVESFEKFVVKLNEVLLEYNIQLVKMELLGDLEAGNTSVFNNKVMFSANY